MCSASPSSDSSISCDDVLRLLMTTPADWLAPHSPSLVQVMQFLLDSHLATSQHRPGCEHEVSALHACVASLIAEIDADLLRLDSRNAPGLSIKIFVSTALQQRLQAVQQLQPQQQHDSTAHPLQSSFHDALEQQQQQQHESASRAPESNFYTAQQQLQEPHVQPHESTSRPLQSSQHDTPQLLQQLQHESVTRPLQPSYHDTQQQQQQQPAFSTMTHTGDIVHQYPVVHLE
jgi:hypothetical protein